jgi:H+-translocating NAD(P) transhydrogenase subunit alpha
MSAILWLLLFVGTGAVGYRVLRAVPALLHTPLMSGMNALSGITVLAALVALGAARGEGAWVRPLAGLAVALAMANVVGGFLVTHRMLRMFGRRGDREERA